MRRSQILKNWKSLYTECMGLQPLHKPIATEKDLFKILQFGLADEITSNHFSAMKNAGKRFMSFIASSNLEILASYGAKMSDYLRSYETRSRSIEADPKWVQGFKHLMASEQGMKLYSEPIRCKCGSNQSILDRITKGDVDAFREADQYFTFLKRICIDNVDLKDRCIEHFIENNERASVHHNLTSDEVIAFRRVLQDLNTAPREFLGWYMRHGNGSTFEGIKGEQSVKDYFLYCPYGMDRWFPPSIPRHGAHSTEHSCLFHAVPKSYKAYRGICMEPISRQYAALGFCDYMIDRLHWSGVCNLRDQEINRSYAKLGSANGEYATLDLTDASDSISLNLFDELYHESWMHDFVLACRSKSVVFQRPSAKLSNPERFDLNILCCMGSGITFPLETLTFWILCKIVMRACDKPIVYGDDIIVKREYVDKVIDILSRAGFQVNTEKSFWKVEQPFRESCGVNAFFGYDVTPIMLSRTMEIVPDAKWTYERLISLSPSLISLARRLQPFSKNMASCIFGLLKDYNIPCLSDDTLKYYSETDPSNITRMELRIPMVSDVQGIRQELSNTYWWEEQVKLVRPIVSEESLCSLNDDRKYDNFWHQRVYEQRQTNHDRINGSDTPVQHIPPMERTECTVEGARLSWVTRRVVL